MRADELDPAARPAADDDVVVFDLGTNDDPANPDALAADLAAARQIAGSRCMVTRPRASVGARLRTMAISAGSNDITATGPR